MRLYVETCVSVGYCSGLWGRGAAERRETAMLPKPKFVGCFGTGESVLLQVGDP
jgi:hypothetical protein